MIAKFILSAVLSLFVSSSAFAEGYVVSSYNPRVIESYTGVVVDRRWVQYDNYAGNNEGLGTFAGAVTGGAVGSAFGRGGGKVAGVLGGAVIGGLLGNSIGRNTPEYHRHHMFEYTLRMSDGTLMTVMQSPDVNLGIGQPVLLERSNDGRWFLIPKY